RRGREQQRPRLPPRCGGSAGERDRRRQPGRSADLLPRPLAQEAPQQAPPRAARVRAAAGAQARAGWPLAPCHRLAGLCGAHVGRARCNRRAAQPRRAPRPRAAAGVAAADPLRDPRPTARPRRLGPPLRPRGRRTHLTSCELPPGMDTALALTTDMKIVLGLVALTMVLFLFQRVRADLVALVMLVLLGLTGQVAPEDVFNGFSSNAVISVIATMILGLGLDRTGALNRLAGWLLRRARGIEERLLLLASAIAGVNSSIMQNPSVMALYLPVISRLSSRTGISLSRMLLPVGVAIVMGGTLTMVGNSPLI